MNKSLAVSEFEALRKELEATSKRVYDTVFFAITASSALLGYGLTKDNIFVLLTPLIILWGAYQIVRQSMRSQRRISAYIRVFHESMENGALWETSIAESRNRNKETTNNTTNRLRVAAQFQLLWLVGAISICVFWVSSGPTILVKFLISLIWVAVGIQMINQNNELAGNGAVENKFLITFENYKISLHQANSESESEERT